jgi:hypothetical protein
MKKILIFAASLLALTACNDEFLDRHPQDQVTAETFFNNESDLNIYVNSLYSYLGTKDIYGGDAQSDNVESKAYNLVVAGQQKVETDAAAAGWTWTDLRKVNFFLENYGKAQIPAEGKNHYAGIARLFRAWIYSDRVKRFGDVPWYSTSLDIDSPELFKARDPRTLVMDSVLNDLNFATQNIRATGPVGTFNKWAANALKARICLHEGTFRKYQGLGNEQKFLEAARDAAKAVIDGKAYSLYSTGNPATDYRDLFVAEDAKLAEVMLPRVYDFGLKVLHAANGVFITPTLGGPGLTKSLINSYLMADGTPFTSKAGSDTATFYYETQNRDPRLSQTIRTPGYTRLGQTPKLVPSFDNSRTGYQGIKFVTAPSQDGYNTNSNDLPIIRYAETLLIYAEARAELGELTQADLDASINLIRKRAGMPAVTLATLTIDPVQERMYPNVTGGQKAAILEIRRERRVELAMEGFRFDDLMRWKRGPLLAENFTGMYFPGKGEFDLDHDGQADIAIVDEIPSTRKPNIQYLKLGDVFVLSEGTKGRTMAFPNLIKVFDESKQYYFPLPKTELVLNNKLTQNPGW